MRHPSPYFHQTSSAAVEFRLPGGKVSAFPQSSKRWSLSGQVGMGTIPPSSVCPSLFCTPSRHGQGFPQTQRNSNGKIVESRRIFNRGNDCLCYKRIPSFLQVQNDENDWNNRNGKRRNERLDSTRRQPMRKNRDPIRNNPDENIAAQFLESSYNILFQSVPLPFIGILNGGNESSKTNVPLVYPVLVLLSVLIFPPITWALFFSFFAIYFSLGSALMGEYDDLGESIEGGDFVRNEVKESGDGDVGGDADFLVPLVSFLGALASSALLSPQGLVLNYGSVSLVTLIACLSLGLSGLMAFVGTKAFEIKREKWANERRQEKRERDERNRMDIWDDKLEGVISRNEAEKED